MKYEMIKDGAKTRRYRFTNTYEWNGITHTSQGETAAQRFRCIGGPHAGEKLTRYDLIINNINEEYIPFNRAAAYSRKGQVPTQVWMHRSELGIC
jgi:hypothetical protein